MKVLLLAAATGAVATAAPAAAQKTTLKADSTCATASGGKIECKIYWERGPGDSAFRKMFLRMDSAAANRPALGLQLRATGTRRDTLGVFVEAVTPKGPAETAGIVEGDRIAAINGVDLRSSAADVDDPYTNDVPSHRLTREVQKLTPGSRVTLRVYSGGRFRDVQVVAGKASEVMRYSNRFNFRVPGPGGLMEFRGPGAGFGPEIMKLRSPMMQQFRRPGARIKVRAPSAYRELAPEHAPEIIRMKEGDLKPLRIDGNTITANGGEGLLGEWDDFNFEPDEWLDAYSDFEFDAPGTIEVDDASEPVTEDSIREMAASTVRDARWALDELAAEGLV